MNRISRYIAPTRRTLVRHIHRLCQNLENLADEVREAITRAISRSMSEAVREVIGGVLLNRQSYHDNSHSSSGWWDDDRHEADEFAGDERRERSFNESGDRHQPVLQSRRTRWSKAIAAGLQAAAWCLHRRTAQLSTLPPVAVGVVTSLVTYVGGPVAIAGISAAVTILGLLTLASG